MRAGPRKPSCVECPPIRFERLLRPPVEMRSGTFQEADAGIRTGDPFCGSRGKKGEYTLNAKLDACHGHTHKTKLDGRRKRRYHYQATVQAPYTIGCYRGTAVEVASPGGLRANSPCRLSSYCCTTLPKSPKGSPVRRAFRLLGAGRRVGGSVNPAAIARV